MIVVGQLTSKLTDSIMGALEEILNDPVTQVDTTQQSVEEVNKIMPPLYVVDFFLTRRCASLARQLSCWSFSLHVHLSVQPGL